MEIVREVLLGLRGNIENFSEKSMKGGKRENSGRKPGGKNKRTVEWEAFGKQLLGESNLNRALEIMNRAKDDDFMKYFTTLSEYFKPKLARSEVDVSDNRKSIHITRQIIGNSDKSQPDVHSGTE